MDKALNKILRKMCELANVEYDPNLFNLSDFYLRHSWTKEQEKEFVKWLSNEIYTNKETWQYFGFSYKPFKKICNKVAEDFVTNYGWTYASEEAEK